jgi:probable rRNA maturation factor
VGSYARGRISVKDRFRPRTERRFVARVIRETLAFADARAREVSLLLTDDREIARVHGEFLGDPTPTDVISFELDDTIDLVVSVECARREARRRGNTIRAELALYVVHGLLHACGYDDRNARERARMRRAEQAVLTRLRLRA